MKETCTITENRNDAAKIGNITNMAKKKEKKKISDIEYATVLSDQ